MSIMSQTKTQSDYTNMQLSYYDETAHIMNQENHSVHNKNPDYWSLLLSPFAEGDWKDKKALDFGCGCGRNVINVLNTYDVGEMHGCDLSKNNISFCNENLEKSKHDNYKFFITDGKSVGEVADSTYDAIISTIVLQHICVYDIRKSILTDMYRALADDGILCIQMGYGDAHPNGRDYYDNYYEAEGTNSACDVMVTDSSQIVGDLEEIGFVDIEYEISHSFTDYHKEWIYVKAKKVNSNEE